MSKRIDADGDARPARTIAAKVAGIYAIATTLWIVGSGYLVMLLPGRAAQYAEISKGLLFGLVTTGLLYVAIHRWAERYACQVRVADAAERRLLQVIQVVPAGVVLVDAAGVIEFANPEALRILGESGEHTVGSRLEDVVRLPEEKSARIMEMLAEGSLAGLAIRGRDDESDRAFIASAARLHTGSQQTGWALAFTDVTGARRENERISTLVHSYRVLADALKTIQTASDTRQLLSAVCERMATDGLIAGAWAATPDDTGTLKTVAQVGLPPEMVGRIEQAAQAATGEAATGAGALLGATRLHVVNDIAQDADDAPGGADTGVVGFGSSATFSVMSESNPLAVVTFFAEKAGFFDTEQIRTVEILRDAIVFAVSKLELEAKRLYAEEALARSESAYRQMFKQSPEPMWVYDRATLKFLAVNDAAIRKYGYTAEEFEAMTIIDIRPPEDIPRLLHSVAHHTAAREDASYWTHVDKNGHEFAVYVQSNGINWNGVDAQLVLVQEVATVG